MLKKTIFALFLATLLYSQNSYSMDARSTALGGATQGIPADAFSSMRNPASMTNLNWGHFILPLSPNIKIGNSTNINEFMSSSSNLDKILETIKNDVFGYRLETNINFPIIGYSGIPSKNFKLFNNPVAIGFNLVATSNDYFSIAKNSLASDILGIGINTYDFTNRNISKMNGVFSNIAELSKYDFSKFNNIDFGNKEQVQEVTQEVKKIQENEIKNILETSPAVLKNLENLQNQVLNFIDNLSKAEKNQNIAQVVADGHLTIMASGATKVYSNDIFDVSVGVNMKGFLFPYNQKLDNIIPNSLQNPTGDLLNSLTKNMNLMPIASKVNLELGDFGSVNEIKNFINNKITPLVDTSKKIDENLGNLNKNITNIIDLSETNPIAIINEIPSTRENISNLQENMNSLGSTININDLNSLSNTFISTLGNDLKNVKINVEQYTDVSPFGLGFDLGVQSKIYKNTVIGLFLQNPLVIWPAKVRNLTLGFANAENNNLFNIQNSGDLKPANYNLSEPFAIKLGGTHNLEYLNDNLKNMIVVADIEQVFNGRNTALHLGVEKGFIFNDIFGLYLRLGGQIGGLGNMLTAGLGLQGGAFNLDLVIASGNLFNPLNSNAASGGLSTSLNF